MHHALIRKELREAAAILGLACTVMTVVAIQEAGIGSDPANGRFLYSKHTLFPEGIHAIPFIHYRLQEWLMQTAVVAALALGLWQTLGESLRKTWGYLLHRPMSRDRLLLTKALTGAVGLMLALAVPVLGLALWAATPGTHASPFLWSFTLPAWRLCASSSILYFAAFQCGLRDARWYGSRFLPLLPAATLFILLTQLSPYTIWTWLPILVADAFYLASLLAEGRARDF